MCENGFDEVDAGVACRQLGYSDFYTYNIFADVMSDKYWLENLQCSGSEEKLCACPSNGIGQESCGEFAGVRVSCLCKYEWYLL